jgi:hypothetical protein
MLSEEERRARHRGYSRRYYLANKAKACEATIRWRKAHPELSKEYSRRHRESHKTARAVYKRSHDLWRYGLTVAAYEVLLQNQHGVCAICFRPETNKHNKRLSVDHDHTTLKVRGLLCTNCNQALGNCQDSPDRLRAAAAYLEKKAR